MVDISAWTPTKRKSFEDEVPPQPLETKELLIFICELNMIISRLIIEFSLEIIFAKVTRKIGDRVQVEGWMLEGSSTNQGTAHRDTSWASKAL